MEKECLVSRLSGSASKALLSLLLTRQREATLHKSEFAILTGLSEWVVPIALRELEQYGLISIVAQGGLREQITVEIVDESTTILASTPSEAQIDTRVEEVPEDADPLDACRAADELIREAGESPRRRGAARASQIHSLNRVWASVFPLPEYEYSQLSDSMGRWLTKDGRSAEWVGEILLRIGESGKHIDSPVSYVRAVVEGEEERKRIPINGSTEEGITDDMWKLVGIGRERYGK